ncbi:unnamed protein product, partial [marine sediment metagenome]
RIRPCPIGQFLNKLALKNQPHNCLNIIIDEDILGTPKHKNCLNFYS